MTTFLADYRTEAELAAELKQRLGFGSVRVLRLWRQQRRGPPWTKVGPATIYHNTKFDEWLRAETQQPVRSRRQRETVAA